MFASRRVAIAVLLGLAVFASSCSADSTPTATERERARPEASILPPATQNDGAPAEPEVEENNDDGRLVIQHADHQLSTILPDGTEATVLTDDPNTINTQPSWAPDGSRIAWVTIDATGDAQIASDRFDRSDYRTVNVDRAPFYLYWDPSASRIAHLSPVLGGIDLGIAEPLAEEGPANRRLDRGEPYFLSWGPDGEEMLVHASGFRLDRIDLGSATIIVEEFPGEFGAPTWLMDDSIAFVERSEDTQVLVTSGASGEGRRPLVSFDGNLRFTISNQGNRIALQVNPSINDEDDIVTASTRRGFGPVEATTASHAARQTDPTPEPTATPEFDTSLDAIDQLTPGVPYLMGTFGGDPFQLSLNPAVALLPSPDGQTVAWLEESPVAPGAYAWHFDRSGNRTVGPSFVPSTETALNYLPFFDQYSQSHDFWSPSSNLFVWSGHPAGTSEDDGVWVLDMTTGESSRLSDGVFAAFTRTPSASGAASAL